MLGVPPAFLATLDLIGVFVFALSGALAAVRKKLDLFGVVVVGSATALGGGLLRDLLIGDTPPASLRDWRYLSVAAVASVLTFLFHTQVRALWRWVLFFDAAGLGLFTVTGTSKALGVDALSPAGAVLIGVLTAVGGGLARDVLLREIPVVLRSEIYAVAALAGAVVITAGQQLIGAGDASGVWLALAAVLVTWGLRILSLWRRWNAPLPRGIRDP